MDRDKCHLLSPFTQGAKNHGVVLPDADRSATITQLLGAAFGAAGQRCMALSTVVFVGEARSWLPELVEQAHKLKVNAGEQILFHVLADDYFK